jgi:hypothetical protein
MLCRDITQSYAPSVVCAVIYIDHILCLRHAPFAYEPLRSAL